MITLKPWQRVKLARDENRFKPQDFIHALADGFVKQGGDRLMAEDQSILGGVGFFHGRPVTFISNQRGKTVEENLDFRFGMATPSGYRKIQRLVMQAEKFQRPIFFFIDTPGAYPGIEAEENGQGQAIATTIELLSKVKVPIISLFTGEGGSGGALAMAVCDSLLMCENSIFSILSPEGFASILWKDASLWREAADIMKITAFDLKEMGICEKIIKEDEEDIFLRVDKILENQLSLLDKKYLKLGGYSKSLVDDRYKRLRKIGDFKIGE